jgi:hypothetical protein
MANLKIVMSTSSYAEGKGVIVNGKWHSTISAITNCAVTVNWTLQNMALLG